ncbi:uncharacterized protein LOC134071194 isoform X5 [Sardina pilchardus]|uniref:uncharacterized protein LOC134071194 isoform X5 n=1 Tax=Sardina pilchardus TaxID=27697 RepID=UPI002E13F62D
MAMQQSQTGSVFCSFYIHCRHQHEENHYTMEAAVGSVRSGNLESLKKGVKLVKLKGKDLLGVTSEEFFKLLSESQRLLSLTIENHGAAVDLPQEDSCDTTEETTLIVTLQDAEIELLCTDSDDKCSLDATYQRVQLWDCKSIKLANGANQYLGLTASGPGFSDTAENITMVEMDNHVFLQFPNLLFLKCEKKAGTFSLKAEENDTLAGLLSAISNKKVLQNKDKKEIFGCNKSFLFRLTKKKENVYTFQPELSLGQFICSDEWRELGVRNVIRSELDACFRVQVIKKKNIK